MTSLEEPPWEASRPARQVVPKRTPLYHNEHVQSCWGSLIALCLFTNNVVNCVQLNYLKKLEEIRRLMEIWMKRCITPLGRIAILKSLILSKLIHLWILLPNPPSNFIDNVQKMCFVFVWRDKQDQIKRNTAQNHIKQGGLGVPNLNLFMKSLKLSWIRKNLS